MTDFDLLLVEIHPRNQSLMNQEYSWENLDFIKPGRYSLNFLRPTITKNIQTSKHDCNENNSLQVTKCYDEFYMSKMNCSFPWLKSYTVG